MASRRLSATAATSATAAVSTLQFGESVVRLVRPADPDRLLDDLLLWQYGTKHIDLTAETSDAVPHPRRDSLMRRLRQIERYRLTKK